MNKKLLIIAVVYILIMGCISGFLIIGEIDRRQVRSEEYGEISVIANGIKQSISAGDNKEAIALTDELIKKDFDNEGNIITLNMLMPLILSVLGVIIILIYIDLSILRPFRELKDYAGEIAKGNLNKSLEVKRGNYFGDFTWAFDNMRREIVKSRSAEKQAVDNNKTVIATLSHDIKTPISSIRAYAEAFEANMDSNAQIRQKYISILMEKCDEVTKLTNDLFLHSISEMNKLEIKKESFDLLHFMDEEVRKLFVYDDVEIILPDVKDVIINADSRRMLQIFENLKSNAEKYAKTKVTIELEISEIKDKIKDSAPDKKTDNEKKFDYIEIHFRDYGPGMFEEEIPFITGKFYRGKNIGDENGSGLGLYIVNELVNRMDGSLKLYNKEPGLDVVIGFNV
ncbi:MAG: HAMP domain-containing histidine kinase [Lachnospiraceae bacterium]|nr:HAMP domain-containing histidine kinase [Lachnospiraceae bacterium]